MFLATLLGSAGALHLLFSGLATLTMANATSPIILPGGVALPYADGDLRTWAGLIAAYTTAQIWVGWLLGPLGLWAARCLIRNRHPKTVGAIAWCNLAYFPTGTTVGILTLIALNRGVMDPARAGRAHPRP